MDDAELTRSLARLGLDQKNWRAVSLLPLIEVAWADGKVQDAERKLLVDVAARYGLDPGSAFLTKWLARRPAKADFLRARTLLLQLWRRAGPGEVRQPETLEQLLDLCLRVAEAAGGLFGILFTVEASERECITEIAGSLQLGPELPDTVAKNWRPPRAAVAAPPAETVQLTRPTAAAAEEPTTVRPPPRPRQVSPTEETTKIRPPRPRSRGTADPDATTRRLTRPIGKPVLAAPTFDEEVTSPYLDTTSLDESDAELDD